MVARASEVGEAACEAAASSPYSRLVVRVKRRESEA